MLRATSIQGGDKIAGWPPQKISTLDTPTKFLATHSVALSM